LNTENIKMSKTYTVEQFRAAIPGSAGIISTIAKRVGCDWQTARNHIDKSSTLTQLYSNERESLVDMAEGVLIKSVQAGDTQDAKWVLSKMGKQRGWGDKLDIEHSGRINVSQLSDDELAAIVSGQGGG